MKKVTLYIDDKFGDALSITAMGVAQTNYNQAVTNVATAVMELKSNNLYKIDDAGRCRPIGDNCEDVPR